ncbi:MAG: hypothetical protein ABSA72_02095 [Nitrososphaerales archaeon]|jgi:hypothetical protein
MKIERCPREKRLLDSGTSSLVITTTVFESKVLKCIDEGLGAIGENTNHTVYWHMEHTFGLRREEIPRRPEVFLKSIRAMFGQGASILERAVEREIRLVFKISSDAHSFEELVEEAARSSESFSVL